MINVQSIYHIQKHSQTTHWQLVLHLKSAVSVIANDLVCNFKRKCSVQSKTNKIGNTFGRTLNASLKALKLQILVSTDCCCIIHCVIHSQQITVYDSKVKSVDTFCFSGFSLF